MQSAAMAFIIGQILSKAPMTTAHVPTEKHSKS